jgi:hypothetical protein
LIAVPRMPSTAMSPTKPNKSETPKTPETKVPVAPAPAESPQTAATGKAGKPSKGGREGKRILSVAIPDKLARQLKLLCNVEGTTAAAIVIHAVQRAVDKRLGAALESIKSDVES